MKNSLKFSVLHNLKVELEIWCLHFGNF